MVQKAIQGVERNIDKIKGVEAKARAAWTKKFHEYEDAVSAVKAISKEVLERSKERRPTPKKIESRLDSASKIIDRWNEISAALTKRRNEERAKIQAEEDRLQALRIEMAELMAKVEAERKAVDEVVENVFRLNASVVRAFYDRDDFLTRHVYPHLLDDDGRLRTQITFVNSDGTQKVVVMVNKITRMDPDLASRARKLVDEFFDSFTERAEMDPATLGLFDLTRNILVEKTEFKVGPDLYRFLGLEIKEGLFPKLYHAQLLLRQSMRSERTDKYIRLYERESTDAPWQQVKMS